MNARLQLEDLVKLLHVPAAVKSDKIRSPETFDLCARSTGRTFTIRGFNDYGMAELWIDEEGRDSTDACADSIWIEPDCLEVQS